MAHDGSPSAKTELARQLFLWGDETGKRVTEPKVLAERVGLHPQTIYRHIDGWIAENEKMLIAHNSCELGMVLSSESIEQFKADTQFFQKQTLELQRDIEVCDDLESFVRKAIDKNPFKLEDASVFHTLLTNFFSAVHTKAKLRSQLIAMEKQWMTMSGIEGKMDVALTAEKERAKAKAKLDSRPTEPGSKEGLVKAKAGGLFEV